MSCAIFTFLSLYAALTEKSNRWIIGASIVAGLLLFLWAAYLVWKDEREESKAAAKKCPELDEQLTDKGPRLTITGWGQINSASEVQVHAYDILQCGFHIRNVGEIASEVKVDTFALMPRGVEQKIASIPARTIIDEGFVAIYLENQQSPIYKWQFEELLHECFGAQPNQRHAVPISITYGDFNGRHYRAEWELSYMPLRREVTFRFIKRYRDILLGNLVSG